MQPPRCETEQKAQMLFLLRPVSEAEIPLETHAFRIERDERDAHPDRRRGDGGDSQFGATREHGGADAEHEVVVVMG